MNESTLKDSPPSANKSWRSGLPPVIKMVAGQGIPLPGNDLDTDRIIPARFMKCVTFDKLGDYLFYDARFNSDGSKKNHPLNDPKHAGATILIVNRNFGCGSSREHAPQSLIRFGIKAIVGESFAEIFADNCTAIGLPLVTAQKEDVEKITTSVNKNPSVEIKIDLENRKIYCGQFTASSYQPEQTRLAFIHGTWDTVAELLSAKEQIKAAAGKLPYLSPTNFA